MLKLLATDSIFVAAFHWLRDLLVAFWNQGIAAVGAVWHWAVTYCIAWIHDLVNWLLSIMPAGLHDFLARSSTWLDPLATFWTRCNEWFPLSETLVLLVTALVVVAVVRLARWVKSFIPLVSG